jgi:hypothetical protein
LPLPNETSPHLLDFTGIQGDTIVCFRHCLVGRKPIEAEQKRSNRKKVNERVVE